MLHSHLHIVDNIFMSKLDSQKHKQANKMRVSFDLDEVLFVDPKTHKTEPELKFPFNRIFKERLRLGTPELINALQDEDFEVWVYTSSFRSERYIRSLFFMYGVKFDSIVNGDRHLREVQGKRKDPLPQKLPSKYRISLHIDDETVICTAGKLYGFNVYQLNAQDDDWEKKIMDRVHRIRRLERPDLLNEADVEEEKSIDQGTDHQDNKEEA